MEKICLRLLALLLFHPYATVALLTRVTDGNKTIEWQTETMPRAIQKKDVYFTCIAGYSSGTSAADRILVQSGRRLHLKLYT